MDAGSAIGLSGALLSEAFPFHFAMDDTLTIVQAGPVLERLAGGAAGTRLGERIVVLTPRIAVLELQALLDLTRSLILLKILSSGLTLKGQVMYEPEAGRLLFLGSPWITDVDRLGEMGLSLRDFAQHDPLTDLLFFIQAKNAALKDAKQLADKLAEKSARLREGERRYRSVVDGIREVIFQADTEGRLTFLNPAWTAMTSFSIEESLGKRVEDFVYPDDREALRDLSQHALRRARGDRRGVIRFLTQAGKARWIEVCARVVLDADDRVVGLMGTLDDITERKLAEEAQLRSRNELARTARLKDEFLANMSHELRTPLNAILGLTEALLEAAYGPVNERQAAFLRNIEESGRHLLTLINEILDLSKIEAGTLEMEIYPVAAADVCSASLRMVKQAAARKRQKLTLLVEEGLPEVLADERRLKQVLVNLLSNAVKFTPEGGTIGLEATFDDEGSAVCFAVRDTGIGISPAGLQMLFKPFVQLDGGLARKHEGAGLGLSLVHRLTEIQKGSVRVESKEGVGSCFTVRLPAVERSPDSLCAERLRDSESAPRSEEELAAESSKYTVLLAEDNELNVQTFVPYLQYSGFRVEVARDGIEAVAAAQMSPPDLILMDVQMPRMDGLEAVRQLRCDPRLADVPIIALTALAMPGDRERCVAAGANDYVSKPIRLRRLVSMIRRHLLKPPSSRPAKGDSA